MNSSQSGTRRALLFVSGGVVFLSVVLGWLLWVPRTKVVRPVEPFTVASQPSAEPLPAPVEESPRVRWRRRLPTSAGGAAPPLPAGPPASPAAPDAHQFAVDNHVDQPHWEALKALNDEWSAALEKAAKGDYASLPKPLYEMAREREVGLREILGDDAAVKRYLEFEQKRPAPHVEAAQGSSTYKGVLVID